MKDQTPLFINVTEPNEKLYASMFRVIYRRNKTYMIYGVIFFALFALLAFCQLYGNLFMPQEEDNWFVFGFFALGAALMYLFCFQGHRLRARQLANARSDTLHWRTTMRFYETEMELETTTTITTIPLELIHTIGKDDVGMFFRYEQNILPMAWDGFTKGSAEEFALWAEDHLVHPEVLKKRSKKS